MNMMKKYSVMSTIASVANIGVGIFVGKKVKDATESTAVGVAAGIGTTLALDTVAGTAIGLCAANDAMQNIGSIVDSLDMTFDADMPSVDDISSGLGKVIGGLWDETVTG